MARSHKLKEEENKMAHKKQTKKAKSRDLKPRKDVKGGQETKQWFEQGPSGGRHVTGPRQQK
jgi:hypothetical protein